MSQVLKELAGHAGVYHGEGVNHEEQPFKGDLTLESVLAGKAIMVNYVAKGIDGAYLHQERGMISLNEDAEPIFWPIMSELPTVLLHEHVGTSHSPSGRVTLVFRHGDPANEEVFRQELSFDLWPNGDVSYRHAWGLPNGIFKERSGARMKKIGRPNPKKA